MKEKQNIPFDTGKTGNRCLLSIEEAGLSKQFYVLQVRKTLPQLPASYSDERCLRLLRRHVKRIIKSLSLLRTINKSTDDWEQIQMDIKRDRKYIKQSLNYYKHLLDELEYLKVLPKENQEFRNNPVKGQLFRKIDIFSVLYNRFFREKVSD